MKVNETQADTFQSQSERHLEAKLELIQRQLEFVTEQLNKGKGKRPVQPTPPAGVFNRLRSSFSGPGTSDQASTASTSVDEEEPPAYSSVVDPDPVPPAPQPKEKTIWIKKVELLLNGIPLDQLDTSETQVISMPHIIRVYTILSVDGIFTKIPIRQNCVAKKLTKTSSKNHLTKKSMSPKSQRCQNPDGQKS